MKRALALLIALTAAFGVATTSFAETSDAPGTSSTREDGIYFENAGTVSISDLLEPGKEYKFPVTIVKDGSERAFVESDLNDYRIKIENETGASAMATFDLVKEDGKYNLVAKPVAGWPTSKTTVEYNVKYLLKRDGSVVYTTNVKFETGYEEAVISSIKKGDTIFVDAAAPVFTKDLLNEIAKVNDYKKVTFTNGDWEYTVNVTDMDAINLLYNTNAIKEIANKFDNQEFKFLSFPAGTSFPGTGSFKIYLSNDEADIYSKGMFLYRYIDGKLVKMPATYDSVDKAVTFETKTLGRFVLTNKEIKDGFVVVESTAGASTSSAASSSATDGKSNPSTGASDSVNLAVAFAIISMVGASAFALNKKSK